MPSPRLRRATVCAVAVAAALSLGAPGAAVAADTTLSVSPSVRIAAPDSSPVTFPGITRVREGETLPRNWVVVSRDVRITRGGEVAAAAFRMTCPKGRTWRGGTASGDILASVLERNPLSRKHSVLVMASFATSAVRIGESATGTVFALCR
ncbi:MAG: hypothetical protein QOE31_3698 [Solirubrobacteraceae bacterium]|nr:hypothetical protein [Solirubrobacteraceae bacterium]